MAPGLFQENFLFGLYTSMEPFAVIGEKLYLIKESNGNSSYLEVSGAKFGLKESENLATIERIFFEAHKSGIERVMGGYIQENFISKLEAERRRLLEQRNLYSSLNESSIESFIVNYIFPSYYSAHRRSRNNNRLETEIERILEETEINESSEEITLDSSISADKPFLCNVLERENLPGFVSILGICYSYMNDGNRDICPAFVLNRTKYRLVPWKQLKDLSLLYAEELFKAAIKKAEEHGRAFIEKIGLVERQIRELEIARSRSNETRRGNIAYKKLRDGLYELSITIEPFIIEKNGKYYAFPEIELYTHLMAERNRIKVMFEPKAKNYVLHPFIWDTKKVCYNHFDFGIYGVSIGQSYSLDENKQGIARAIALILRKAEQVIVSGYFNDGRGTFSPVNEIDKCNAFITDKREEAESYAISNNIDLDRIISN